MYYAASHVFGFGFISRSYGIRYKVSESDNKKIEMTMGSKTGENYCSKIYRARIHYNNCDNANSNGNNNENSKCLSLIIKSMPFTKATNFLIDMKVFLKEKIFYLNVLPLMEIFTDNGRKFGAQLYHCMNRPIHTFIFQDLNHLGYRIASREEGFNDEHVIVTLKRLAEFHAISVVLNHKNPKLMEFFDRGMLDSYALSRKDNSFYGVSQVTFNALIDLSRTLEGYDCITKKLEKYSLDLKERLIASQSPKENEFRVLNHGDLWVNNILIHYDDNNHPQDVLFVDYQMAIWSSPGIDLNYFFYTSLPLESLRTKRDYYISIYHRKLIEVLERCNYSPLPTLEQIKDEVRKRAAYGFFANHTIYPIISMNQTLSHDSSLENFSNKEFTIEKFRKVFAQEHLKQLYAYTLKEFYDMNIYD